MSEDNIEPVAVLPTKRRRQSETDWELCVFCQQGTPPLRSVSNDGIQKVKEAFSIRWNCGEDKRGVLDRLHTVINELETKNTKWHTSSCYASFYSKTNLQRLQKKKDICDSITYCDQQQPRQCTCGINTRRLVPGVDLERCQKRTNKCVPLHQVQTDDCADRIHSIADSDPKLKCKIGALDLITYEIKYHSKCMLRWNRVSKGETSSQTADEYDQAFASLVAELDSGFERGHIYSLSAITKRYVCLLKSEGSENKVVRRQLKEKLTRHYGSQIQYVRPIDQKTSLLVFPTVSTETAIQGLEETSTSLKDAYIERNTRNWN